MSRFFDALQRGGASGESAPLPYVPDMDPAPPQLAAEAAAADPHVQPNEPAASQPEIRTVRTSVGIGSPWPFLSHDTHAAEQYRIIRTKLLHHIPKLEVVAVSSAGIGDGKSTSALNIASAMALKDDITVLLVDGDFRRSSVSDYLGISSTPGLAEVLRGRCPLQDAIVRSEALPNLYCLPLGEKPANPAELLDSERWHAFCASLRGQFRFTIVDCPPVGVVADYELIQRVADGVVLIVRPDHTDRTICAKALETVLREKLVGVVMNSVTPWFLSGASGHSYYSYKHGDKPSGKG